MATNPDEILIDPAEEVENGKPFLIVWNRVRGDFVFPNGPDLNIIHENIQTLLATAKRTGMIELWPSAVWHGKVDLTNPVFVCALLEAAGVDSGRMPAPLVAINPWTSYPPLPPGAIS